MDLRRGESPPADRQSTEQWAGNRDDDCRNRSNGKLIEDDLVGRAPITTKQFVEDFKAAFS